jgi:LacI family transcriptional regulator
MSLSNNTKNLDHLKKVIEHNVPLVLFDKISKLLDCSKVVIDDKSAGFDATEHLIKSGCKKIAHIRGPLNPQGSIDRFLGYKKALEDNNMKFDSSVVFTCEKVTFNEGYEFARKIHKEHSDVDGIFAITDLVGIGAVAYFNDVGVKIPEQIAIIGFSNWFMSSVISPSLSTIDQPGFDMGKEALKLLLKEIKATKTENQINHETIVLPTNVIKRNSTAF